MDLRFAIRSLRKTPGFTLLAVLVMALGIGANTAMFSVVNTVLLKPLAYRNPDRIVTVRNRWVRSVKSPFVGGSTVSAFISAPDFHDWHDQNTVFSAMAFYAGEQTAVLIGSTSEYAQVTGVTPEFFSVFSIDPLLGREFDPEEEKPGAGGAAVISEAYWRAHFGGNPNVIGRVIRIYNKPLTIVGVLPSEFRYPDATEIWYPANTIFPESTGRSAHNYFAVAQLKPGVSVDQAQAQMDGIAGRLEQLYPKSNGGKGVFIQRMSDTLVSNVRTTLYLLLGAVGVVLLIACGNMANLLLAKSTARTREIAIRAAVGASRWRIVRQLITESIVLAMVSGVIGLILAVWGKDALVALAPANVPRLRETSIDGWVLAFTFGISVLSSILFGLVPALNASRVDLNDALKQSGSRNAATSGGTMRNALVVGEVALSMILLAAAGLLIKSFVAMQDVNLGFHPDHVLVMETSVPSSDLESAKRATRFYKGLLADISALPGASSAGATMAVPGTVHSNGGYWLDHLPPLDQLSVTAPQAIFSVVAPGTFKTLGIDLKTGRDFNDGDGYDAPFVALINEALAKKSFPGQNPIGHLIFCGMDSLKGMTIVGIVGDVRQWGPATAPWPEIYMNYEQHPRPSTDLSVLVRTSTASGALVEPLRRKVREHSAEVPVKFTTMDASLAENVATPRFRTLLLGIFAALAVCLAMAGVYGVTAYVVSQRANEVGLRMALGAQSGDVLKMILAHGMKLAAIGIALGLAGSIATSHLLSTMLFEVKPTDPLTYAAVAVLLGLVALGASYIPARRATHVDPLISLRQE